MEYEKLSFSPQSDSVFKRGEIIGCNQAQVWDIDGNSLAIIEPHNDENIASDYAKLFAAAPALLNACIEAEKHHQGLHSEIGNHLRQVIRKALKQ